MSNKIKISEFNVSNVSFQMKIDQKTKRKIFFVNHNKQAILIQTPRFYLPNGLKHWKSDAYPESFELELSFGEDKENEVNNSNIMDFQKKMSQLDDLIKQQIMNNPKDWVGKPKASMEMIETAFYPNPIVRVPKDKDGNVLEYAPRMRLKVERETDDNGSFTGYFTSSRKNKTRVMVFDENNSQLNLTEETCESVIPRGSKGIVVMELVNINVVGDKVYPKWKLVQAKVYRNQQSITDNIIDDVDEVEDSVANDLDSETPVQDQHETSPIESPVQDQHEIEPIESPVQDEELDDIEISKPVVKTTRKRAVVA
jgi:hypothetical protein